jgi:16S rRNA processing protein RimM
LRHPGLSRKFEELEDRDSAELWRGRYLLAPFSELPPLDENEVYLHDLVGMRAESPQGELIGTVSTYYELPQGIMLDIQTARGSVLVPYRPEAIVRTDVEGRTIVIDDRLGFLENSSGSPE